MIQKYGPCYWLHRPAGGFGWVMKVPCRFLAWLEGTRVLVEVQHADGATNRKILEEGHVVAGDGKTRLSALRREAVIA